MIYKNYPGFVKFKENHVVEQECWSAYFVSLGETIVFY